MGAGRRTAPGVAVRRRGPRSEEVGSVIERHLGHDSVGVRSLGLDREVRRILNRRSVGGSRNGSRRSHVGRPEREKHAVEDSRGSRQIVVRRDGQPDIDVGRHTDGRCRPHLDPVRSVGGPVGRERVPAANQPDPVGCRAGRTDGSRRRAGRQSPLESRGLPRQDFHHGVGRVGREALPDHDPRLAVVVHVLDADDTRDDLAVPARGAGRRTGTDRRCRRYRRRIPRRCRPRCCRSRCRRSRPARGPAGPTGQGAWGADSPP